MTMLSKTKLALKQEIDELSNSITSQFDQQMKQMSEILEIKKTIENVHFLDGERKGKKSCIPIRKSTIEALETMEYLLDNEKANPSTTKVTFIGNAGLGKSSFMNMITNTNLLPCQSGSVHVTKVLFHVLYGSECTLEIILCTDEEVQDRCQKSGLTTPLDPTRMTAQKSRYADLKELHNALQTIQNNMTESDIYHVKMIKATAPIQAMKELGFEVIDVPGLNGGDESKVFECLAVEACKLSDRGILFNNSFRGLFPTDCFELIGKVFNDPHVQKNPMTFCYCFGGRYFDEQPSQKFQEGLSSFNALKMETTFQSYLSNLFDYKFDDIPRAPNEKPANNQIEFVENKRTVLEFLKEEFRSFPIPHFKSPKFKEELEITKLKFELMLKKDKIISMKRLIQKIRDLALLCIPNLISKSKHQTGKNKDQAIEQIYFDCFKAVKHIVKSLRKYHSKKNNLVKGIDKYLEEGFLVNSVKLDSISTSQKQVVVDHITLMEEHIRALAEKYLKNESNGNKDEALKIFTSEVLPLFDLDHEDHIILATKMKGVLNDLFQGFIKTRNEEYETKFETKFSDVKRDMANGSVLKLPSLDKYGTFASMISAKIVSNSDCAPKSQLYRRDETTSTLVTIPDLIQLPLDQESGKLIIDISVKKNNVVEFSNTSRQEFQPFQSMIPPSVLLDHNRKTRLAPIFFISMDGNLSPLALKALWKDYTTETLIVIATPREHVSTFVDLAQKFNVESHQVRIMSVSVENGLYSEGSLMSSIFHFATFFEFPIVHIVKNNVKCIHEYISPMKEYITNEWTPVRYFRSVEALTYKEVHSLDEDTRREIVDQYWNKYCESIFKYLLDNPQLRNFLMKNTVDSILANIEQFIESLKLLDSEINKKNPIAISNMESTFKTKMFANNKGRIGCWNGKRAVIDRNKIYSRDGYNYMVSNYATGIESYFMQAIGKLRPLADEVFMKDLPEEFETIQHGFDPKMINFRTNLLSHGVGGFLHFGFKYELVRGQSNSKRKTKTSSSRNNKKRK